MGTIATAGFAPLLIDRLRDLLDLESPSLGVRLSGDRCLR